LAISFLPTARPLVLKAVERYRRENGAIHLALAEALDERQLAGLVSGRIDIAVVRNRGERTSLHFERLIDSGLFAALSVSHRFSGFSDLTYADLAEEDFVLWPRHESPGGFDHVIAGCRQAGFEPRVATEASGVQMLADLVAAGVGISILGGGLREELSHAGLVLIPLRGERDTLYVGWRASDNTDLRRGFTDTLLAVSQPASRPSVDGSGSV